MENASKALLIAGAILIVILLIAVGMLVYSKSRGVVDTGVAQMSSAEIQMFNAQFTNYEGIRNARDTTTLLQQIRNNNTFYKDDKSRWVEVTINVSEAIHKGEGTVTRSFNDTRDYEYMQGFFDKYIPFITGSFNTGAKTYDISFEYKNGLIKKAIISQLN